MEQPVKIIPKNKRAKNRVKEHGELMHLVKRGKFRGEEAVLVVSLDNTWRGVKWMGWFTTKEADIEEKQNGS